MLRIARRIAWSMLVVAAPALAGPVPGPQDRAERLRGLGVERVRGVRESGFHNTEGETEADSFRWTDGDARLVVPFEGQAPALLQVRLDLGRPRATRLTIRVNQTTLFDEKVQPRAEWARTFDLRAAARSSPLEIQILSDVFVPSEVNKAADDDRRLGVRVRGIALIDAIGDVAGVNLAVEAVPGVDVTGVHWLEQAGRNPFRWTEGPTRFVVPMTPGRRWKSLTVALETPDRPDWRVQVAVNGRKLADEVVRPERAWRRELSLDGIDLGPKAVIELTTPAIPSGQGRSKDSRVLGVRLREVTLVAD